MKSKDKRRFRCAYPLLQELLQALVSELFLPPKDAAKTKGFGLYYDYDE
jgi:hypothetical protein